MRIIFLLIAFLFSCKHVPTKREAYCEAARRRATQCWVMYPTPDRCEQGSRIIGDPDEMSCREIVETINELGYLW